MSATEKSLQKLSQNCFPKMISTNDLKYYLKKYLRLTMSVTRGDAFLGGGAQPPLVALGEHWICHHCNGVGIGICIGIDIGIGITIGIG